MADLSSVRVRFRQGCDLEAIHETPLHQELSVIQNRPKEDSSADVDVHSPVEDEQLAWE